MCFRMIPHFPKIFRMTTPEKFYSNILQALQVLEGHLAPGSILYIFNMQLNIYKHIANYVVRYDSVWKWKGYFCIINTFVRVLYSSSTVIVKIWRWKESQGHVIYIYIIVNTVNCFGKVIKIIYCCINIFYIKMSFIRVLTKLFPYCSPLLKVDNCQGQQENI